MEMSTVICSMPSAIVSKDLRLRHMDMLVKNDQLDSRDNSENVELGKIYFMI